MRPIRVNFREPRRAPAWQLGAAALVLAGVVGWQLWRLSLVEGELRDARAELANFSAELESARARQKALIDKQDQAAQTPDARSLAKMKAFPLDQVFTAVESSKTEGIRLTLLDISANDNLVRIECDYESSEAVFRYVEKLNSSGGRKWVLTSLKSKSDRSGSGSAAISSGP